MAEKQAGVRETDGGARAARRGENQLAFTPPVDVFENDREVTLLVDLPGARPEDVQLRYDQGELTLEAPVTVPGPGEAWALRERPPGRYLRTFRIHELIDSGKIEAECKNGVLTVHLPKTPAAQPRQVKVKGG